MADKGTLYLIPTVIASGAESTVPDATKAAIKGLDFFIVENVRTARRYISSLKLGVVIEDLDFQVLDKKTSDEQVNRMLDPLKRGVNVGVLSESGCPGVADPGSKAVKYAHQIGSKVIPLTGPSSLLLALMASGFNGQKFAFHGYLPIDHKELTSAIKKLETQSLKENQSQLFIETPYRNNQLLKKLLEVCNPASLLCVARDVTGPEEVIKSRSIKDWKKEKMDLHKRPTVFILYAGIL